MDPGRPKKGHILAVDDDHAFCELVEHMLSSAGFEVTCVYDISAMEDRLTVQQFDLILLDLCLAGEGGLSFLQRTDTNALNIPVLVMTGNPDLTVAVSCFKEGAGDCIFKPFSSGQLLEAVNRCLYKKKPQAALDKTIVMASAKEPDQIAGYAVSGILGHGNMGIVYLVTETEADGSVSNYALKVLKRPVVADPKELAIIEKRFLAAAKATHNIHHPNVIQTFNYGVWDGHLPYILMEYSPGQSLDDLMVSRKLDLNEKCFILAQIAEGLAVIHNEGMCHRDLKPANIMVTDDLTAKITDFGLVRLGDSNLTMTSDVFGTPSYLSPESFFSAKVDFRADQFSFGCLAYELLVGRVPFQGASVCAVARQICEDEPIWPRQLDDTIPGELDALIRRALEKDPFERFEESAEIVTIIRGVLNRLN